MLEQGRASIAPPPPAPSTTAQTANAGSRTIKDTTTIELKLAITLIVLGASAGGAVGGLGVSWNQASKQTELSALREQVLKTDKVLGKYAETVIANIDMPDHAVKEWVGIFGSVLDDVTAAKAFNTRAFRIYQNELRDGRKRSPDPGGIDKREFRKVELQRALRWVDAAIEKDPDYHTAHWNRACFSALLGDADDSMTHLEKLQALVPPSSRAEMRKKICTDEDLCAIQSDASFMAFIAKQRCEKDETRKCTATTIR